MICSICGAEFEPKTARSTVCYNPDCQHTKRLEQKRRCREARGHLWKRTDMSDYYSANYSSKPEPLRVRQKPIMSLDDKLELCRKYDLTYAEIQQIVIGCSSKREIKEKVKRYAESRKPN